MMPCIVIQTSNTNLAPTLSDTAPEDIRPIILHIPIVDKTLAAFMGASPASWA